jgi:hypothetical protein
VRADVWLPTGIIVIAAARWAVAGRIVGAGALCRWRVRHVCRRPSIVLREGETPFFLPRPHFRESLTPTVPTPPWPAYLPETIYFCETSLRPFVTP